MQKKDEIGFLPHIYILGWLNIYIYIYWYICIYIYIYTYAVLCLVALLCPTLCDPLDCSPPGSSVHGILQARILEWIAMPSSRGFSQPRDLTCVSCIAGGFFTSWPTREAHLYLYLYLWSIFILHVCTSFSFILFSRAIWYLASLTFGEFFDANWGGPPLPHVCLALVFSAWLCARHQLVEAFTLQW